MVAAAAAIGATGLALTLAAVFGGVVPAGAATRAPAVQLAPPTLAIAPPCAGGSSPFTDQHSGLSIAGAGVNVPVSMQSTGNCFTIVASGTSGGAHWNAYQNGDGHCLWLNGITIELGNACHSSGHPNEEIWGISFVNGGWALNDLGGNSGTIQPTPCTGTGAEVQQPGSDNNTCNRWSSV
jgi:hypothetical protein